MPNLLAIETTTDTCSVAAYCGEHVEIERTIRKPRVHAEQLVPMIQEVLEYTGLRVHDLDGIAVSSGPGSYTGLRIGASTAKGLAYAHDIKIISVPSLAAMAHSCRSFVPEGGITIISRNSRRGEVYLACFEKTHTAGFSLIMEPAALTLEELPSKIPTEITSRDQLWLAGEGSAPVYEMLPEAIGSKTEILPPTSVSPSASSVAQLGAISFKNSSFVDVSSYEPIYLKDFIPKLSKTSVFDRLPF